jgi:hypothetical protein
VIYTEDQMRDAMMALYPIDPESVLDMAEQGPMEEPFCAACTVLIPLVNDKMPGWKHGLLILEYHDEPTYGIGRDWSHEDDYPWAIGLTQVFTYHRCLKVYKAARDVIDIANEVIINEAIKGLARGAGGPVHDGPG